MVATKTIVIAGIIIAICVTALVVGIVLGTRNTGCSGDAPLPEEVNATRTLNNDLYTLVVSWAVPDDEDCDITYKVSYEYHQSGAPITGTSNNTSVSISPIQPCVTVTLHIWAAYGDVDDNSNHAEFNFTMPPVNINPPTDITFNDDGDNLVVSWAAPSNAGECDVTYRVVVTSDGTAAGPTTVNTASYTILDNSYCITAGVSVTAVTEESTSSSVQQLYTTPVTNFVVTKSTDNTKLIASWDPIAKSQCALQYKIVQTIDGQKLPLIETQLSEHNFDLEYCVDMQFEVTAFVDTVASQSATTNTIREEPTEIPTVTNVEFTDRMITWQAPARHTYCSLTYDLKVSSDIVASATYTTSAREFPLASIRYCFFLDVALQANYDDIVGTPTEAVPFTEDNQVNNLQVKIVDGTYFATWDPHPGETEYDLKYQVVYDVEGEDADDSEFSITISESEYSFNPAAYCIKGTLTVTAVRDNDYKSDPATEDLQQSQPAVIEDLIASDGEVSWKAVEPLGSCVIQYQVTYIPDTTKNPVSEIVSTNKFTVPSTSYCFKYDVTVSVIASGMVGNSNQATDNFDNRIENLEVTTSPSNPNQYIARWSAHRKSSCNKQYRVVYFLDGEDDANLNTKTTDTEHHFDKVYCAAGTVFVSAVGDNDIETAPSPKELSAEGQPAIIADLTASDGEVVWKEVEPLGRCVIKYRVTYNPDTTREPVPEIVSTNKFTVPSTSYCFKYDVTVSVIASDIVGDSNQATDDFDNRIENLEVTTSPSNPNQYIARWSAHRKSSCNIRYRVVYSLDGEDDDELNKETTDTEYPFDKVYCAAGTLFVSAVGDNDLETPPSPKELSAEGQPAIIADLTASDGEVVWKEVEPLGRCVIEYRVTYNPDTTREPVSQNVSTNKFTVPSTSYCFKYDVTVSVIVSDVVGNSNQATDGFDTNIELTETISPENNQISVTFIPHAKRIQCEIEYTATYSIGEDPIDFNDDTAIFAIVYCQPGTITVTATSAPGTILQGSYFHEPISPVDIGRVQNIRSDNSESLITIYWDPPPYVHSCDLSYTVTATVLSNPDYDDSCEDIKVRECSLEEACDMDVTITTDYGSASSLTPYEPPCDADAVVIHVS